MFVVFLTITFDSDLAAVACRQTDLARNQCDHVAGRKPQSLTTWYPKL